MDTPSRVAEWSARLGTFALALCAAGPLGIQLGLLSPFLGFRLFSFGLLGGLAALLLGALGLWTTRAAAARTGRGRAWTGLGAGAALVTLLAVVLWPSLDTPVINDISTDPDDPPAFRTAGGLPANAGRALDYPPENAAVQRAGYPQLEPIRLALPPPQALAAARRAGEALGWEVHAEDAAAGTLEATHTSRIFRFVDDVVVRVRPASGGSQLDVRSKSRDGRGDMGANAARIEAFKAALLSGASGS